MSMLSLLVGGLLSMAQLPTNLPSSWDGRVVSKDGRPVVNAAVTLYHVDRDKNDAVDFTTKTDAEGKFHLDLPKLGEGITGEVVIQAPGYGCGIWPTYEFPYPTKILLPGATTFTARFLDPEGHPVVGMPVAPRYFVDDRFGRIQILGHTLQKQFAKKTDSAGMLTLSALPQGAMLELESSDPRFCIPANMRTATLQTSAKTTHKPITLLRSGVIEGIVKGIDGKPAAGISVGAQSTSMGGWGNATTDSLGRFHIEQLLPGHYLIALGINNDKDFGATGRSVEASVLSGKTTGGVTIQLERGVVIEGTVLDSDQKPVSKVDVGIYGPAHPQEGGWVQSARTDANGKYHARVPAGKQYVYLMTGSESQHGKNVEVNGTETRIVDFSMSKASAPNQFLGVVLGVDGKPAPNAEVDLSNVGEPGMAHAVLADEKGEFSISLSGESASLVARAFIGADCTVQAVSLVSGTPARLQLVQNQRSVLTGVVQDEKGHVLSGADVQLFLESGGYSSSASVVVTDAKGTYTFENLYPDMSVNVLAKAAGFGGKQGPSIHLKPNETKAVPIQLPVADQVLEGKVVDEKNLPVVGAEVDLTYISDGQETTTDSQGRFRFDGVSKGRHLVFIRKGERTLDRGVNVGEKPVLVLKHMEAEASAPIAVGTVGLVGKPAPELQISGWLNSSSLTLKALRGRVVVIDFWAIWCGPCRASLPDVKKLAAKFKGQKVTVIGLHDSSTWPKELTAFAKKNGLTYALAIDKSIGSGFGKTNSLYGVMGIPSLVVIDQNGNVAGVPESAEQAEKLVSKLMK